MSQQQNMGSGRDAIARALMVQQQANQQPLQGMSPERYERGVQMLKQGIPPERGMWPQQFREQMGQQYVPEQQVQKQPIPQSNMPIMQGDPEASTMTPDQGGMSQDFAPQMEPSFEDQYSGGMFEL